MSVEIHTAFGKISEQLRRLNTEMISACPDFIASGFFLPSSLQKGALIPVTHQGGSQEHRERMDENILYRRLLPEISLAARAHQENRVLFDKSIMFPNEHQCYCLPVGIKNDNTGLLQLVFKAEAWNKKVAVNSAHIDGIRSAISSVPDIFLDFEKAVFTTDFAADYNIVIHIDVSDFRQLSRINGYREAETFVSAFFTQEMPHLLNSHNARPLRMEGDGMRLMIPADQYDVKSVLESFVSSVIERFAKYAADYKRGFDNAKLKVVCEIGEVLEKEIKLVNGQVIKDLSGPVDTRIQEMISGVIRKDHAIVVGPMLQKISL